MDLEAKTFHKETVGTSILPKLYGEPWRVFAHGRKVSSRLTEELRILCTSEDAIKYWGKKQRFGTGSVSEVDWDAFGAALKQMSTKRQHWISKTTSGFCAVGVMMFRWKEHPSPACPRCNETETVEHVWRCQHDTENIWDKSLSNLKDWMLQHDTHPEVARVIIEGLRAWRSDKESIKYSTVEWVNELVMQQNQMGWRNFFEGMLSTNWQLAQNAYFQQIGSRKSSKRWATAIIRKMWQIAWDLWEHRNGFLHDKNTGIHSQTINKLIQLEFQKGWSTLDRETRALFRPGNELISQKPLEVREQWVKRVQAARLKSETAIHTAFHAERAFMSAWLKGN
jgi:hypothetical protein